MLSRRGFLLGGLGGVLVPFHAPSIRAAAVSKVGVAIVGLGFRGRQHLQNLIQRPDVDIVAIYDPDKDQLAKAKALIPKKTVITSVDFTQDLPQQRDVDAVVVATPAHWTSFASFFAFHSGKAAYVEYPISHNIHEATSVYRAANLYKRVAHAGTHLRANPAIKNMRDFVQAGALGKVTLARAISYNPRPSIGRRSEPLPIPKSVDFRIWSGPAPEKPLYRDNLHGDWRFDFNTGTGDMGDDGANQVDLCRYLLGTGAVAPEIVSIGGRFGYIDAGDTPNTLVVYHGYQPAPIILEVRGLPITKAYLNNIIQWSQNVPVYVAPRSQRELRNGVVLHCEKGELIISGGASGSAYDLKGSLIRQFASEVGDPVGLFLSDIITDHHDLSNLRQGMLSTFLCHAANISYGLGHTAAPADVANAIKDLPHVNAALDSMRVHLRANGIDLAKSPLTLGARLKVAVENMTFTDPRANARMERLYNSRFHIPPMML